MGSLQLNHGEKVLSLCSEGVSSLQLKGAEVLIGGQGCPVRPPPGPPDWTRRWTRGVALRNRHTFGSSHEQTLPKHLSNVSLRIWLLSLDESAQTWCLWL